MAGGLQPFHCPLRVPLACRQVLALGAFVGGVSTPEASGMKPLTRNRHGSEADWPRCLASRPPPPPPMGSSRSLEPPGGSLQLGDPFYPPPAHP